ncbi:MAG TPA: HAMP domain-containing sensor histidine kinase, partial [Ornithinibacter sp.]|nr:HAMP domain-containing sensor histidine kinase [Ornithinibacter sp.]
GLHTIEDLSITHDDDITTRVSQVVDASGTVVLTSDPSATRPLADPQVDPDEVRVSVTGGLPGIDDGTYAVAVARAVGLDGEPYTAIVATPTRIETTALGRSLEFAVIGAVGLVAILGAVTTFAVGQALRPVDRMRDQVEAIASSRPEPTLEVPAGRDELSRLAETLNRVLDRLRRADASRRGFVADAGHELRSPLATIRVLLDRLAEDRPEAERRLAAERAAAEVDRLSVLVDDLLALASADEHAMSLATAEVDLDDVVLSEAGALRARGMPVAVTVEPVRVLGDAHRLGRVVRNLLENAERHRESVVRLTLSAADDEALLVVDNDGPPVALADRERIFGRFVRLDDSRTRDTGGTGLGLAIVSEIVGAHGGTVRAEESPEGWCRFAVRLPLDTRSG